MNAVQYVFLGSDVAAVVAAMFVVAFAQIGLRVSAQRHYLWMAAGCVVFSIWWSCVRWVPLPGPFLQPLQFAWQSLGILGQCLFWVGLIEHFGIPSARRAQFVAALLIPSALYVLAGGLVLLVGGQLPLSVVVGVAILRHAIISSIAIWAAYRERGLGHWLLAVTLLIPLGTAATFYAQGDLRSQSLMPFNTLVILGLCISCLPMGYRREERRLTAEIAARRTAEQALIDANEQLERRIRDRTVALLAACNAAEAGARAKARFLAVMSHEIRTPLQGLTATLELLGAEALTPSQQALVATSNASGQQLRRMLDDVLDFSRLEAGLLSINVQRADLHALCATAVDGFSALAAAKGLTLTLDCTQADRFVVIDAFRVRQILDNFLANAIKFTFSGGIEVRVSTESTDLQSAALQLFIEVSDTGCGVAEPFQESIFEPFEQGESDSLATRPFSGTGLGLALCRQLSYAMGGDVACADRAGGGSVFSARLQCSSAEPEPGVAPVAESVFPVEQALIGKRLLVVENSPILLALLKNILLKSGATVRLVADGREAVEAVAAEPFDAVLMDVTMPGMNGLDATRAIRAMHADQVGGPRLPIIGISAHAMAGDREECLAAGMTDYLTKPVQLSVLVRAVGRAIEGAAG